MKVCVYTLGCKVNQYESGGIVRVLKERGHEVLSELVPAELYIINTCAVTNEAERKSRQVVARCGKLNPKAKIVVCGCSGEHSAESFEGEANGRLILGTSGKGGIVNELERSGVLKKALPRVYEDDLITETERVRAYIKVQDGCNRFCSYCIVPYLRGRSRSREVHSILREIALFQDSVREIVITGIDLSDYRSAACGSLTELMRQLAGVPVRIRLGSLEARVIDEPFLLALKGLYRFCPHFHLSLQSGSNGVLHRMNRHYTTEEYLLKVRLIRSFFPDAGVTTDVIAGFPTETEAQHRETVAFVREVGFSDIHVFGYSPRGGTAAAAMKRLPGETVKARTNELLAVKQELKEAFLTAQLGKTHELLLEQIEDGYYSGYTENYIRGYMPCEGLAENEIHTVRGEKPFRDGLLFQKV